MTASYRYFRFQPTALRGPSQAIVQVAEFWFLIGGNVITPFAVTSVGDTHTGTETAANLADNSATTKWKNTAGLTGYVLFDFGVTVNVDGYRWETASDAPECDPISWTIEGSLDNSVWTRVDTETSFTGTTTRSVYNTDFATPSGTPTTVSGLYGWWQADSITGIANGATITNWFDSGPRGFTMTQATSANRPTYVVGMFNNLPIVRFGGTHFLMSTASASQTTYTFFAVVQASTISGNLSIYAADNGGGIQWEIAGTPGIDIHSQVVCGRATTSIGTAVAIISANYTDGGNCAFFQYGTADGTPTFTGTLTAGRNGWIGARQGGQFFSGDIAEVIVYNTVLSASDRAIVHTYLADKYQITVSDYVGVNYNPPLDIPSNVPVDASSAAQLLATKKTPSA